MMQRYLGMTVLAGAGLLIGQTTPTAPPPARTRAFTVNYSASGSSYIGVGLGEVDAERARQLKLKEEHGVELTHIEDDSPAAQGGLKVHDVVLEYNGQRVEGMEQFARFVRETPAGREVKLAVSRDGARQTVAIKIAQRKMREPMVMNAPMASGMGMGQGFGIGSGGGGETPRPFMVWVNPRIGIDAEGVEGQLGQYFGVKEGVLIRAVSKGSAAEKAGLKAGDVITKVDGNVVTSAGDVTRAIRAARSKKTFPVTVMRERHEVNVNVTIEENQMENQQGDRLLMFPGNGGAEWLPGDFNFHFEGIDGWLDRIPETVNRTIRTIVL
jgi:serine protease Do